MTTRSPLAFGKLFIQVHPCGREAAVVSFPCMHVSFALSHSFIFITFPNESKDINHSLSSSGHLISSFLLFHTTNTFATVISQDDSFYFPSLFCRSIISLLPDNSDVFHFQVSQRPCGRTKFEPLPLIMRLPSMVSSFFFWGSRFKYSCVPFLSKFFHLQQTIPPLAQVFKCNESLKMG